MKPVIRYQSQLLYRKSYKPSRRIRVRPDANSITRRPTVVWRSDNYPVPIQSARSAASERMIAWLASKGS